MSQTLIETRPIAPHRTEEAQHVHAGLQLRPAIVSFVLLTILTGIIYPAVVTVIAHFAFPWRSAGSVIEVGGKPVASTLIGQPFTDPNYFWSRPSATSPNPYEADASSGSNLGPTNPALLDAVKQRIAALRAADPGNDKPVPVDLVTSSASGLDPDISVAAAEYQAPRIARLRRLKLSDVQRLIDRFAQGRAFGFIGEPRVNVVELNLALDGRRWDNSK
ncbi:MAG TPA: potassium-transporting ATPase subunit KdpC [Tepidisphaeraceae bacterium]|nr:potassium-transporting ATPase subunit KdpC [Tepidisphaeraceae bacterium]